MTVRSQILGLLAAAGGCTLGLFLAFLPEMMVLYGRVWTPVILGASLSAMIPFVVSQWFDGLVQSGVRGLLRELRFTLVSLGPFAFAVWWVRTRPDTHGFQAYMQCTFAVWFAAMCCLERENDAYFAARDRERDRIHAKRVGDELLRLPTFRPRR